MISIKEVAFRSWIDVIPHERDMIIRSKIVYLIMGMIPGKKDVGAKCKNNKSRIYETLPRSNNCTIMSLWENIDLYFKKLNKRMIRLSNYIVTGRSYGVVLIVLA